MLSIRRHHTTRLKNNRKNYWGGDNDAKRLGKIMACPAPCSCPLCGNDRQYNGATLKERSNYDSYDFDMGEL